jgi:molybdate transport system substrate-binding protein
MIIKLVSGGAMRSLVVEAMPLFERKSGVKVEIELALTSMLMKEIEAGAAFDVALLPRPELDALVRSGKIAAGGTADVTRSAVGLAVRSGAPKPDIRTVAALTPSSQRGRLLIAMVRAALTSPLFWSDSALRGR